MRLYKFNWPLVNTLLLIVEVTVCFLLKKRKFQLSYILFKFRYRLFKNPPPKQAQYLMMIGNKKGMVNIIEFMQAKEHSKFWKPLNHEGVTALEEQEMILIDGLKYNNGKFTYTEEFKHKSCSNIFCKQLF